MINNSQKLLSALKELQENVEKGIDAKDINEIVGTLIEAVEEKDNKVYSEIKSIGDKINQTRQDINTNEDGAVAEATMELDAVVQSTESATNKILDIAEEIQSITSELADKEKAEQILQNITKIFEACNFQDLTGQRIKKVTATLNFIEDSVGNLLKSLDNSPKNNDKRADADLLNGPQMDEKTPNQDDIDKMFDEA